MGNVQDLSAARFSRYPQARPAAASVRERHWRFRAAGSSWASIFGVGVQDPSDEDDYLAREARARKEIDKQLAAAGWKVQSQKALNLSAGPGVAVREFTLEKPHGRVDYLLFLNGQPAGVIEAKPEGTTLTEVERQSGKYVEGLPDWMQASGLPAAVHLRVHRSRDPVHQRV